MKITMLSRQKVVVIAQERCFHGGSNYRALTGKNLVFWIDGRLWEVVTHGSLTVLLLQISNYV